MHILLMNKKSIDKLSLWLIKLIHVGFRAHVKIASRIVSYQYYYKVSLKLIYRFAIAVDARSVCDSLGYLSFLFAAVS